MGTTRVVPSALTTRRASRGSVWSADEERGLNIARQVRTGTIGVNYYNLDLGAPFGGMKDSGIGRELGPEAINPYLEYKSIYASADQLKG